MNVGKRIKERRKALGMSADELATKLKIDRSTVYRYESNDIEKLPTTILEPLAEILETTPGFLMGWKEAPPEPKFNYEQYGLRPVEMKKFPMLGNIACGEPIVANQEFETFIEASANIRADFCLTAKGDSMINANIHNGDIVFIKEQPDVDDGKIAAVLIDDEVTLKRVYKSDNTLTLIAENPEYKPLIYTEQSAVTIKILGRAVAVQSLIK